MTWTHKGKHMSHGRLVFDLTNDNGKDEIRVRGRSSKHSAKLAAHLLTLLNAHSVTCSACREDMA